ncbi:unnamed protein product [Lupinus luteus]|uniref:J domain-containing protein n=1 Tax=Lupinus luteus TaxID=3873 RepID=A0AAV1VQ65_LUPLU
MQDEPRRAEAERLLGIAEDFLKNRDLNGSRDFAILAQKIEPLIEGSDQVLAIVDVISAAHKPLNGNIEWYTILQVDRLCQDIDLIKRNYRRLALFLHPDKNYFTLADFAFKLVSDAWEQLSDPVKKAKYDYNIITQSHPHVEKEEESKTEHEDKSLVPWENNTLWTACPYCYYLYEYPRVYEDCSLRCQNCEKTFHGVALPSLPPLVPGREAYYCTWGFFPMGFVFGTPNSNTKRPLQMLNSTEIPSWNPSPQTEPQPLPPRS